MVFNNKTGSLFLEFNRCFLKTRQIALHSLLKYGLIVEQVASSAIDARLQNSRFFFSKSVKKSVKRGVRILSVRSARASHARKECEAREIFFSVFLASLPSLALFSASFQTFCLTARAFLKRIRTVLESIAAPSRWDHRKPTLNPHEQSRDNVKLLKAFVLESFRFEDENHYEYEIFSILSIARAWTSVTLAGKRDSCRYSTSSLVNIEVVETSYQMLGVYHFPIARGLKLSD